MMNKTTLSMTALALAFLASVTGSVHGQTVDKVYAKSLILPGNGGTDLTHLLTITAPTVSAPVSITMPSNNVLGPLTNDGSGNLSWGGPAGVTPGSPYQFLTTNNALLHAIQWQGFTTDNATLNSGNGVSTSLALNLGNSDTWTAAQTLQQNSIGTTPTDALLLTNGTAAANNSQQYSPRLRLTGQGWETGTSASQEADWVMQAIPVQGAANPTSRLDFQNAINGTYTTTGFDLFPSGGASLGITNPTDPGAGVFNAAVGFQVNGAAASGTMLIGNGTDFVPTAITYPTTVGAAGNILWSNGSSFVSNPVTTQQYSLTNVAGTTSTTGVMMGFGGTATFKPGGSGIILILITGNMGTSANNGGTAAQIYYGSGTAPSHGAALTGTAAGSKIATVMANGLNTYFFCLNAIVGGGGSPLSTSTTYWIDAAVTSNNGSDTAVITNVTISVFELE
jgi:hypothetical protein